MGGGNSKVVEEWRAADGSSWYRKWSSGFIEQGGNDLGKAFPTKREIVFAKPFTTVVLSLMFGSVGETSGNSYEGGIAVTPENTLTLTGFTYVGIHMSTHVNNSTSWYACGY